ncbi:MAG: archaemetzincin family Zn-dependent metalloprotease [Candidatus Aenigmatarchaeota archaeon]
MAKITIVQLGKISENLLSSLTSELREIFGFTTETTNPVEIPRNLYNYIRQQYPAPLILRFLEENFKGRVLGITDKDLYAESLNFVFGQAYCPGRIAVVSTHRLNPEFYKQKPNEDLLIERTIKEAVHEIGHTLGLRHCTISSCVMSFSNTVGDVDRKSKNFCQSCFRNLKI